MKPSVSHQPGRGQISRAVSSTSMASFGSCYDDTVHPRSCPRHRRHRCARRARQCPRSRGPRRELGLSPHLGGRASQHAGHRQRRDIGRDWPYRRGNKDHPCRRRRHHAAQPCALRHRRTVRDAGATVSRPHRPRAGPRTRHRPAHAARLAPHAGSGRELPAGRSRAAGFPGSGRSKPAHPGGAGGRNGSAVVDPGIEQFRRDAGGRARAALRLRLAFRARTADPGAADLPQPFQAFRTA